MATGKGGVLLWLGLDNKCLSHDTYIIESSVFSEECWVHYIICAIDQFGQGGSRKK